MLAADDSVKVVDFGLARRIAARNDGPDTPQLTNPGHFLGTPGYASPEQATGNPVDERSDIFTFGILLYEMLFGTHPFQRDTPARTTLALMREEPVVAALPALSLRETIHRALAKDPAARHQSAGALLEALNRAAQELEHVSSDVATEMISVESSPQRSVAPARSDGTSEPSTLSRSLAADVTISPAPAFVRQPRAVWAMTIVTTLLFVVSISIYVRARRASHASLAEARRGDERAEEQPAPKPRTTNAEAWTLYSTAQQAARDASSDLANELFEQASKLDPTFAAAHLGYVETALRVSETAREHYRAAMLFREFLNEEEHAILEGHAPLMGPAIDRRAAAEKLGPLLDRTTGHAFLVKNVSKIRRFIGDAEGALELSDRVLKRLPSHAAAWEARGQSLLELGRNDEAKAAFRNAYCTRRELPTVWQRSPPFTSERGTVSKQREWREASWPPHHASTGAIYCWLLPSSPAIARLTRHCHC